MRHSTGKWGEEESATQAQNASGCGIRTDQTHLNWSNQVRAKIENSPEADEQERSERG